MGSRAENFERRSGRNVPADYRTFLDMFAGGPRVADGGLEFRLATADELLAPYALEGTGITRPFFSAHILHLARLRDAGVLLFDGGPDPVSPERFEPMNTIGVGATPAAWDQGLPPSHLLVLDPANGSLRRVPTDPPAVVRKVSESFAKWLRASKRKPKAAEPKVSSKPRAPKKAKPATPATVLAAFKKSNKLSLPLAYARFLKTHDGAATFPGPGGEAWQLATLAELADPHTGSAQTPDGPVAAVRLTRAYADAVGKEGATFVPVCGTKQNFTLARLRKAVCVGHCNGDPLFLDPGTKYSVWGYSRDGKYVGKLAENFAAFLSPKAQKPRARKTPAPGPAAALKRSKKAPAAAKPRAKRPAAGPATARTPRKRAA